MELLHKHTAVQVSGCRECLSMVLVPEDSRDNSCVLCDQVDDLLSLVAELKEEVERLRSIRECEREIDWWSCTLQSLRPRQQEEAPREVKAPLHSFHRAERGDLRDGGGGNGNWSLLGAASECPPGLPHLPNCTSATDTGLWNVRVWIMRMQVKVLVGGCQERVGQPHVLRLPQLKRKRG